MIEKKQYQRSIQFLAHNGLLEKMINADHLLTELNSLPIEAVERKLELLHSLFGKVGANPTVERNFHCDFGCNIFVGDNFYAGYNCTMLDYAEIRIGDNCLIGPNVGIYTTGHNLAPEDRHLTGWASPINIGDNVWIGGGSTILPGVRIGDNSIVGAGSVVIHEIPNNQVWAGNPARFIKRISSEEEPQV